MKWQPKRNQKGGIVPSCWITDSGYLVAEIKNVPKRFIVTRPGESRSFCYAETRSEVISAIKADQQRKES